MQRYEGSKKLSMSARARKLFHLGYSAEAIAECLDLDPRRVRTITLPNGERLRAEAVKCGTCGGRSVFNPCLKCQSDARRSRRRLTLEA